MRIYYLILVFIILGGCHFLDHPPLFTKLSAEHTSITFNNIIKTNDSLNVSTAPYIYNGGGVAAGDINNDGLLDLYFSGNMVSSRLYLNKGDMRFEEITELSGTATDRWATGVSMVDINSDGFLDIYVSVSGTVKTEPDERKNLLFINNGDLTFTESASRFGLTDSRFTSHAAFFDYDLDGDLDAFLTNNFPGSFARDGSTRLRSEVNDGTSKSADVLYENNGNGSFKDVSIKANILKEGYSLGLVIHDVNRDGWPDIYVSNDLQTDDLLYINKGDKTFIDKAEDFFKHTSYAGMGADIADINNDGWPELLQLDMSPNKFAEQKLVTGSKSYKQLSNMLNKGYQSQYSINTLQMSNGVDDRGNVIFSEIGRLAGIAKTNWSWSALFGDYDNDGYKDIMITNGYPKQITNIDYQRGLSNSTMFGTESSRKKRSYEMLDKLKSLKLQNYMFRNNGNLTFSNNSSDWGFGESSFSYGAVHTDLDNDGDLDVVINNIDSEVFIYRNEADAQLSEHQYLRVKLEGSTDNTQGIGTEIIVTADGEKQYQTFWPYRGYKSSAVSSMHFGLDKARKVDSLEVFWPDGRYQLLTEIPGNQQVRIKHSNSELLGHKDTSNTKKKFFKKVNKTTNITFKHEENNYNDFKKEPLLPHQLSRLGPALASGDINGDGRSDFFIGGAVGAAGKFFIQQEDGAFKKNNYQQPWSADNQYEDVAATIFDANDDGRNDLYVVSGGNEFPAGSEALQDRLYINTGDTKFIHSKNALPEMLTSGSCVKPADYDGDGDTDLFICGRLIPGNYPYPAKSYVLRNEGGSFTDITPKIAPDLVEPGLVTDAEWADYDGDGDLDLITTGIWMPIQFYENENGVFQNVTHALGLSENTGWWFSLTKGDFNGDGDIDFVAGNLGLNHLYNDKYAGEPLLEIFASDFNEDRVSDFILAKQIDGGLYPLHGRTDMIQQMFKLQYQFPSFESFSEATVEQIIGEEAMANAMHYSINLFNSSYLENQKGKSFEVKPLPMEAQISSVNDMLPVDVDDDGNLDIVLVGNLYNTSPNIPRFDAGNGLWLKGNGKGNFEAIAPFESGFLAPYNAKSIELINTRKSKLVLVGNNNDSLQVFKIEGNSNFILPN